MSTKRKGKVIRSRKFRDDASIVSVTRSIEEKFGFPKGSVRIQYPSGRKARTDSTLGKLKKAFEEDVKNTEPEKNQQLELLQGKE